MINYCKKSSLENLAQTIKNVSNDQTSLQFPEDFITKINNIKLIELKSNPNIILNKNNLTYTLPQGQYTGGSVSVIPEELTITPTNSNQPINDKILKKVTILPIENSNYKIETQLYTVSSKATNLNVFFPNSQISNPEGAMIVNLWANNEGVILTQTSILNETANYGVTRKPLSGTEAPGGVVKSPLQYTANSIYCNNPTIIPPNGSTTTGKFYQGRYYCILWGT